MGMTKGFTSEIKINPNLFCIPLGLHYLCNINIRSTH